MMHSFGKWKLQFFSISKIVFFFQYFQNIMMMSEIRQPSRTRQFRVMGTMSSPSSLPPRTAQKRRSSVRPPHPTSRHERDDDFPSWSGGQKKILLITLRPRLWRVPAQAKMGRGVKGESLSSPCASLENRKLYPTTEQRHTAQQK